MKKLIRCKITVTEDQIELAWGLLALHINFGWEEESLPTGETLFTIHAESAEFINKITDSFKRDIAQASIIIDEIPLEDWTEAWREYFTPIECGNIFVVLPPWLKDSTNTEGRTPIIIEPKSAFGTGHHNTTALCLGVISDLLERERINKGMNFLDIGTGSGILGLGLALHGLYGIGVDIEIPSVENSNENKQLNNILAYDSAKKQGFDVQLGSVELVQGQSFNVVVANILAGPLKELAADIIPLVKKGGCLILSGILGIQAQDVINVYTALGLAKPSIVEDGDWVAIVWEEV